MTGDSEQERVEVYEFVAGGAENTCERCMALEGTQWREPPSPPHAHCECEVQLKTVGMNRNRNRTCEDNEVTISHLQNGTVTYGPAEDFSFEWGYLVEIDCWDGLIHAFEIWVDMGKNNDYPNTDDAFDIMEAYAWSELQDEIEAVMARVCRPCPQQLVS
jgi:hypothetical protein